MPISQATRRAINADPEAFGGIYAGAYVDAPKETGQTYRSAFSSNFLGRYFINVPDVGNVKFYPDSWRIKPGEYTPDDVVEFKVKFRGRLAYAVDAALVKDLESPRQPSSPSLSANGTALFSPEPIGFIEDAFEAVGAPRGAQVRSDRMRESDLKGIEAALDRKAERFALEGSISGR